MFIACDDIYENIYWGDKPYRTFLNACPELKDRSVVINGVSKGYAMTGWRIGYLAGPADLVKAMRVVQGQSTSCPSSVSQAAAVAALSGPQDCVAEMCLSFEQRFEFIHDALNEIPGVDCPDCDGAFYAFPSFQGFIDRMDTIRDDVELASWLLTEAGVATVPGSAFGAPGHLRLSFASSMAQLEDAINRIKRALNTASQERFIRDLRQFLRRFGYRAEPRMYPLLRQFPSNAYTHGFASLSHCVSCTYTVMAQVTGFSAGFHRAGTDDHTQHCQHPVAYRDSLSTAVHLPTSHESGCLQPAQRPDDGPQRGRAPRHTGSELSGQPGGWVLRRQQLE